MLLVIYMAREKKLDYVILGLLTHEDLTGYEIKKRIDGSLRYFFNASFGSIYPSLTQLEDMGCVISSPSFDQSRGKIVYSITDSGRERLLHWLRSDTEKNELRYETLLKLFFGKEAGPYLTRDMIARFEADIRKELKTLRMFANGLMSHLDDDSHFYYYLTVKFGIKTYEAYIIWCQEAKELLESRENI